MPLSNFRIPPPVDGRIFETMCCQLWALEWNYHLSQLNGRPGQKQNGVDIWGYLNGNKNELCAIQCKVRNNSITKNEIKEEVAKAEKFDSALKFYTIATTAKVDVEIQNYVRELSKKYNFIINVLGWEQITLLLDKYPDVYNIYYSLQLNLCNKNEGLIKNWYNNYITDKFELYSSFIINSNYNIEFSPRFLNNLIAFECYLIACMESFKPEEKNDVLINYFNSFVLSINDISNFINETHFFNSNNKLVTEMGLIYWVDDSKLDYYQKGSYIEVQKLTLKYLFLNLVKLTNTILIYVNKKYNFNFELKNYYVDCDANHKIIPFYREGDKIEFLHDFKIKANKQVYKEEWSNS
ncbi:TPA: restriction endonuclease [Acinetobacter baumannii]|nr:restriction endonuclease [Acinetobacter baumannii]